MASTTPLPHWAVLPGPAEWAETDPLHVRKHPATACTSNCFSIHASRYCCYRKLVCRNKQNWSLRAATKAEHRFPHGEHTIWTVSITTVKAKFWESTCLVSTSHVQRTADLLLYTFLCRTGLHTATCSPTGAQEPSAACAHSTAGSRTTGSSGLPTAAPFWNARTSEILDNTWLLYLGVIQA